MPITIECEYDPWDLIWEIGAPNFSVCDEDYDQIWRHANHPDTIRVIDCHENLHIDITGESPEDSRRIAKNLCKLLNQEYWIPGMRQK